jgi:hypothetical protein
MKKISFLKYLAFIIASTCVYNANCQDLQGRLQKQMWYVKGDMYKGDTCSIYTDKIANCSGYLIFTKEDVEMRFESIDFKFVCAYQTLNDKIKLHYTVNYTGATEKTKIVNLYYRLKEKQFSNDFDLVPISDKEYN